MKRSLGSTIHGRFAVVALVLLGFGLAGCSKSENTESVVRDSPRLEDTHLAQAWTPERSTAIVEWNLFQVFKTPDLEYSPRFLARSLVAGTNSSDSDADQTKPIVQIYNWSSGQLSTVGPGRLLAATASHLYVINSTVEVWEDANNGQSYNFDHVRIVQLRLSDLAVRNVADMAELGCHVVDSGAASSNDQYLALAAVCTHTSGDNCCRLLAIDLQSGEIIADASGHDPSFDSPNTFVYVLGTTIRRFSIAQNSSVELLQLSGFEVPGRPFSTPGGDLYYQATEFESIRAGTDSSIYGPIRSSAIVHRAPNGHEELLIRAQRFVLTGLDFLPSENLGIVTFIEKPASSAQPGKAGGP